MSLRGMIPFLILVFLVAIGGTYLALQLFGEEADDTEDRILVTVEVIITATPDPDATSVVQVVTATPERDQVAIPTGLVPEETDEAGEGGASSAQAAVTAPTLDPTLLDEDAAIGLTATALPSNCLLHVIAEGDTPFGVAEQYETDGFLLMEVNDLTEETAVNLQIGDTLIVPLEGCSVEALQAALATEPPSPTPTETPDEPSPTPTDTPEDTPTPTDTPTITPTPTITLAPTAVDAQLRIVRVDKAGDVTAEGVVIRNDGNPVDLTDWVLSDSEGNEFRFPQQRIFSNGEITVYTRAGQNTPIALFWGRDAAVWDPEGDIVTLTDDEGSVQATIRIAEGEADG